MNTQKGNKILYSESLGTGTPVVLLPGMLGTTKSWRPVAEILAKNHQITAIDLLGFGRSPAPQNIEYSMDDHTQSIFDTVEEKKIQKPFALVGHSMGALIALVYARRFPKQVEKLILISPPVFKKKEEVKKHIIATSSLPAFLLYGQIARFLCAIFCQLLRPITAEIVAMLLHTPKDVAKDTLLHTYISYSRTLQHVIEEQQVCDDLKRVQAKTTILFGENDDKVISRYIYELSDCKKDITIKTIPGGHRLQFENPEKVAKIIDAV